MDLLFNGSNYLVLPFWLLMIFLPGWRWTRVILSSPFVAIAPALLYAILVVPRLWQLLPAVARPDLQTIMGLLGSSEGATIAWLHFLAFDLFVGRWIYLDAHKHKISTWLVSPLLVLTLLFGPMGFLLYLMVRLVNNPMKHEQ